MILIESYDKQWQVYFAKEQERLFSKLNKDLITIKHVGSTAIPGLNAKPIIDILLCAPSIEYIDNYIVGALQGLEYNYIKAYNNIIAERRYFKRKASPVSYNLHAVTFNSAFYQKIVKFKEILLINSMVLRKYQALKQQLSYLYDNEYEYAKAKSEFIETVLKNFGSNISLDEGK